MKAHFPLHIFEELRGSMKSFALKLKEELEARAEKRLRESAEERSARLLREVSGRPRAPAASLHLLRAGLAGDTSEQQAVIETLSRRLDRVRHFCHAKARSHFRCSFFGDARRTGWAMRRSRPRSCPATQRPCRV